MIVRDAKPDDAVALARIYAHDVLHGAGTFEEVPPSPEDMAARLKAVQDRGMPWVVVEDESQVLGYAYAAPFRTRSAYRFTAEDSVYVAPEARGRGVGRLALSAVITACEALGVHQLVAVIGDSANAGSSALHRSLGFDLCGVQPALGYKNGRWLDVVLMQKALNGGSSGVPEGKGLDL